MHTLRRYPPTRDPNLFAHDSADTLLLSHLATLEPTTKRVLVVNDTFGALAYSLGACDSYSDSYTAHRAFALNGVTEARLLSRLGELEGLYDLVVLRFPKTMAFLEDILAHLSQHLAPGASVICGTMVKHLAPASFTLLEKYIGPTHTSLAQKKARLVFARFEREPTPSPYPQAVALEGFAQPFVHHANLFSREKLDGGTALLLDNFPTGPWEQVLDLGCGNGILGIRAQALCPTAALTFSDVSRQALQSAEDSYTRFFPDHTGTFTWTHAFEDGPEERFDLVLCNPPFHQEQVLGDEIAWQMFVDARRALRPGGLLRIVGNSHLGYHHKLKRLFGKSQIVATDPRFLIVDARK